MKCEMQTVDELLARGPKPSEPLIQLVRFAHKWDVGMLVLWNNGFWGNGVAASTNIFV